MIKLVFPRLEMSGISWGPTKQKSDKIAFKSGE